ncbi:unnamed protein product [Microthlaspi erraticum]|uniref:Retrotransposon gag domain-containing protein n=1 Tax=Microthlaspi erraticum TaxID=1685480 RepID=A0A6D2KA55_9BRAS|nr:unnamed protein product [Microthlaspi erraticum]
MPPKKAKVVKAKVVRQARVVRPAASSEIMMEELQRYRERFGDQMRNDPGAGNVHQPDAPLNGQNQGVQYPPVVHVPAQGRSYWELMGHMRNMQMDHFDGKTSDVVADNWRKKLEKNLDAIRCPQEYRLDLVVHYLKDDAMIWWDGVMEVAQGH